MRRPVWQRWWYILTTVFAIALLVVALQWNTSTVLAQGFAQRPVPGQLPLVRGIPENIQAGLQCLDGTSPAKARVCPMLPAALRPGCLAFARESCLLS